MKLQEAWRTRQDPTLGVAVGFRLIFIVFWFLVIPNLEQGSIPALLGILAILASPAHYLYIAGGFEIGGTFVRGLGSMNPTIGCLFLGA